MSRNALPPMDVSQQVWFNNRDAAEYMRRLGFRDFTHNTVMHAARTGKLHRGEPMGKSHRWHKDWLDEWAANCA